MIISSVLNAALTIPFTFEDDFASLVTGKVNGDFTKAAYLAATPATTATASVAPVSGQSGDYAVTLAANELDALGLWRINVSCTVDGTVYRFGWTVQVIPAAADSAALATAIAGVQTTVDAQDAIWTSTRAARLDRIGTGTVQVSSPSISDGTRLDFTRGDAYLNADGLAKSWTVDDVTVASATLYLRTFAGATVLSKAMTVSGTTVRVDITALETAAFSLGTPVYRYEIVAILSGGSTATVARGDVWVVD